MAQLTVDIGGRPGIDCRGFCEYCYFRRVKDVDPLGCRHCLPFKKGCDYCTRSVKEYYSGFKSLRDIADDTLARLNMLDDDVERVTISGGGDPSCYPRFRELVELLSSMQAPLHIGYTSGKGFDSPKTARFLVENGLSEISFTVFSVNPSLRKKYMHDPTPEASLKILGDLCGSIDVYAASVVLPGVNDGENLVQMCEWLEDRGARGIILMRFANSRDNGLILGNPPIIAGQKTHTPDEFRDIVTDLSKRFKSLKVSGTPLWDPEIGSPFAILAEPDLLAKLPMITGKASIVTGTIAAPYIRKVLSSRGEGADVVPVAKDIACLITIDDLEALDPGNLEKTVIIPGRAFVHDREALKVLSSDGVERTVIRGPDTLTADAETSMGMTRNEVLAIEMEGFADLIRLINIHGTG
ncbi:MAG TPA: methyl coenzyme M reductase-arginine methyltransferase Mmp10 [Methanoregulaceae archaeon]|nr:methyl coenzyme M reductase-arginine methyltransferase Mmp10 [Methanoregulaceae archaeon]